MVQIAHGVAENPPRYNRLATAPTDAGFHGYANDHRGHGQSVDAETPRGSFGAGARCELVADIVEFGESIWAQHPQLRLFLLGRSMG